MKNIIPRIKFFIVMLVFWFILNFNFELTTILFGIIISFFVSIFAYEILHDEHGFRYKGIKIHRLLFYFVVLFIEIFKASFVYIVNLISKQYEPVIFKIVLDLEDPVQVAIVANSITLTPGTITVDIVDHTIFVMVLAKPGATRAELEKPIREKFEKLLKIKEDKS
ncbi:MAG: Na+/H+ antiporter subunit E [Tenericutes bacterium]|jgi:multicomponent Na+:H+ antiporter subunit E|nr:Na+/H+ antiporter subunit E [Mycoplasmatota bacterium]